MIQLYINTYIIFEINFHYRLLQYIDYSFLCYTVKHCLLHIYCVLKTKDLTCYSYKLTDDLLSSLFYSFYFIFSAPISFSLCFPVSPSLLFMDVLSQVFIKHSVKAFVYIHINDMYNIYIF